MVSRVVSALKTLRRRLFWQHLRLLGFSLLGVFFLLTLRFDSSLLLFPVPEVVPPSGLRIVTVLGVILLLVAWRMLGYLAPGAQYLNDQDTVAGMPVARVRERAQDLARRLGLKPPRFRVAALESVPYLAILDRPGSRDDLLLVPTQPEILGDGQDLEAVLAHEVGHLWAHTGLQNTLRVIYQAPFQALEFAGYGLIYLAYWPRVGPILALFPAILYGFLWHRLMNLFLGITFARWNSAVAYTNEFLADTVALQLLGLEAVANMLVRVHFRILVQVILTDLANYLKTLAPLLGLDPEPVASWVQQALRDALSQHPYSVEQAARSLLRNFFKAFGDRLEVSETDLPDLPARELLSLLLKRIPRHQRLPLALQTPITLLALNEGGPEQYDRYPPYGQLDTGELRSLVRRARRAGKISIGDLPSDTHPSILARLQHLLSIAVP